MILHDHHKQNCPQHTQILSSPEKGSLLQQGTDKSTLKACFFARQRGPDGGASGDDDGLVGVHVKVPGRSLPL